MPGELGGDALYTSVGGSDMKRALLAVLFLLADLTVFAAGSFTRPFGVTSVLASRGLATRIFIWDGVLLMLGLLLLTLALEAIGRRLRWLAPWTVGAFAVAALLGYLLRLGFVTREF